MTDDALDVFQEGLLAPSKIRSEITKRLSVDQYETISPKLQSEYEAQGWVLDTKLKLKVKMRRAKSHDVAFEDRVWATMAKLNFADLNQDRAFRLPYGNQANETQQIDVFAADDHVVLIIECKSTGTIKTDSFKKDVEAIQGSRPGLVQRIKKRYPDHKIKFILATNNFGLTEETQERIKSADILHMDDETIDYYLSLAEHLGKAARYQLLGALFAGQKIPGIESTVPAIESKMGGYIYYSFAIEPARLLTLSYILHRNKANSALMPTYQRLIKKSRLKKVTDFVDSGGFFPNSIIINIESGRRRIRFDRASMQEGESKLGLLHLPQTYRAAYVIDGQHRLYGYSGSDRAETDLIPVVAFVDLPRDEQVRLFMQINENQQAVPKNLRSTLNADLLWGDADFQKRARALKLTIAQYLGEDKKSPLYGRVIIGENSRTSTRCITIDAISNGLDRSNFIGTFSKTEMKTAGTFYRGDNQSTLDALTAFLDRCFAIMRDGLPSQWDLGNADGGFVFINNGVEALIRIFSDIVDHVMESADIHPSNVSLDELVDLVEPYLNILVTFLSGQTLEEALDFRRQYGSAGRAKYWRRLQAVLNDADANFEPPGFAEYETEQEKKFNVESFEMIRDLEQFLSADTRKRLENHYGATWLNEGVPLKVKQEAGKIQLQKNHDKPPDEEVELWDCLHLIDYKDIMQQKHELWTELFAKQYTRPGDEKKAWKSALDWLVELNRIRNENAHNYVVTEEEYETLVVLTEWLIKGQADNVL
jgi:DNA sulfur modification protein DndB